MLFICQELYKDAVKIGPLVSEGKGIIADDFGVANLLKTQYESVFSKPNTNIHPGTNWINSNIQLSLVWWNKLMLIIGPHMRNCTML